MLTEEKYKEFVRRSQEDEYSLTSDEKKQMVRYLNYYNEKNTPLKYNGYGGGLIQIVARGPGCWSGGLWHRLHWKDEGSKKCWWCDSNHC